MPPYEFSQNVDSGPYCSPECESLDDDIIIHNVKAMEAPYISPYISRFTGNDSAGIQAWAAEVPPGAPDGGLSSKIDIKLCSTPKPPDFPTSLVSSLAPIDPPATEDASGHSGMSFGHSTLFSAPQNPDSFASTHPLDIGDTSGPRSFAFEQSTRMFDQAHDINITGGQFYNATGGISISENSFCYQVRQGASMTRFSINLIDTSQDASTNLMHIMQHIHVSNQVALPRSTDEGLNCHTRRGDNLSSAATSCVGEDGTTCEVGVTRECMDKDIQCLYLGNQSPDSTTSSDLLSEQEDPEPENQLLRPIQVSAFIPSSIGTLSDFHLDLLIFDTLSNYPPPPTGNFRSFQRILAALLFSFSPLSLPVLSTLLGIDSTERVKQILLPLSPFILVSDSNLCKDEEQTDDQGLVRFADSSTRDFFVDTTRSQEYYVDGLRAHKVLLDGCTWVMGREEQKMESLGWRGAFEYACRHWERHRHAAVTDNGKSRAKL